jgi:hypothetical protein
LVTVYQSTGQGTERAPRLQVMRLSQDAKAEQPRGNGAVATVSDIGPASVMAHVQRAGDVGGKMGDWLGSRGSKQWIEGFAVIPPDGIPAEELEYQAVLGRGWNSPWMEGGKFCGSRGMALPLLGVRLRLKGDAAKDYTLRYAASFVDGTLVGPVDAGEACEAEGLAALEALQVMIEPRGGASQPGARPPVAKPGAAVRRPTVGARLPGAKPGVSEPEPAVAQPAGAAGKPLKPAEPVTRRIR